MTVRATKFDVHLVDEGVDLDRLGPGWLEEASIEFNDPPKFRFTAPNPGGINAHVLANGDEVNLLREQENRLPGIIDTVEPVADKGDSTVEVWGMHVGYKLMQARLCDAYDFDEDGNPGTTRDAVTVNPWKTIILRDPDSSLDVLGRKTALTGVRPDEWMQMLIGTKHVFQMDFQDTRWFLPSTHTGPTKAISVWRDGQDDDVRPSLQLVRDGSQYKVGDPIETIPLVNGDKNIDPMGDISVVDVEFIGEYDGTHDPIVDVCRNAFDTRTYTTVTLTREDNWNGTTLSRWTGQVDLSSDSATNKNALGAKINFTPATTPTATTSKIFYARFDATTVSDTGITEGTLETYSNPVTFTDSGEDWIETDLLGFNRLDGAERIRKMTESDAAVNPSPHWDAWIDSDLDLHFSERRGSVITGHTYSFEERNLEIVRHRFFGGDLAFQTVAYGAGSGTAQTRIVTKTEFSSGGLYDSDRDPGGSGHRGHRVMPFRDPNEQSATNLLRKARAFHKLHRDPVETFEVTVENEYVRIFSTGDSINVENLNTKTNDALRAVRLKRKWGDGGLGEDLETTIGENREDLTNKLRNMQSTTEVLNIRPQPTLGTMGLSGNGIPFDATHFGVFPFSIPEGAQVERVKLRIETVPWQAMAKAVDAGHTHDIDPIGVTIPSLSVAGTTSQAGGLSVLEKAKAIADRTGEAEELDYGQQDLTTGTSPTKAIGGETDNVRVGQNAVNLTQPESQTYGSLADDAQGTVTLDFTEQSFDPDLEEGLHLHVQINTEVGVEYDWEVHPGGDLTAIVRQSETDHVGDTKNYTMFIPSEVARTFWGSGSQGSMVLRVTNKSGATASFTIQLSAWIIPKHLHSDGTLSKASHALADATNNLLRSPATTLTATDLEALLGAIEVGYREDSGGTGAQVYEQPSGTFFYDEHEHQVSGQTTTADATTTDAATAKAAAALGLDFGIYQFDGASGDGTGAPVYGIGVKMAVDPTVDANGIPTDFGNERVPHKFGTRTVGASADIDITNFLSRGSDNRIESGPHKAVFQSEADGVTNPDGLCVVRVTPIFTYKEQEVVA